MGGADIRDLKRAGVESVEREWDRSGKDEVGAAAAGTGRIGSARGSIYLFGGWVDRFGRCADFEGGCAGGVTGQGLFLRSRQVDLLVGLLLCDLSKS